MTIQEEVKYKLENYLWFRERSKRGEGLVKLALRSINCETTYCDGIVLSVKEMQDFAIKYDSYRHAWGEITRIYPELRGSDYDEKEKLVEMKQQELGYYQVS